MENLKLKSEIARLEIEACQIIGKIKHLHHKLAPIGDKEKAAKYYAVSDKYQEILNIMMELENAAQNIEDESLPVVEGWGDEAL